MTKPEWAFYINREDNVACAFTNGLLHIKTVGKEIMIYPEVVVSRRGKIGHYLREILGSPNHPILFNRWFIQKLEESPVWSDLVKQWREEAVQKKNDQLEAKRWRETEKNRPPSERELKTIERLSELQLAHPAERTKALAELKPHVQSLKATLEFLELYQHKYFLTGDNSITELGKVGRCLNTGISIQWLESAIQMLDKVSRSLAGEVDYNIQIPGGKR